MTMYEITKTSQNLHDRKFRDGKFIVSRGLRVAAEFPFRYPECQCSGAAHTEVEALQSAEMYRDALAIQIVAAEAA
jgi:hypothetical protein